MGSGCSGVQGFLLGVMKRFETRLIQCLHNTVDVLKTTDLVTYFKIVLC